MLAGGGPRTMSIKRQRHRYAIKQLMSIGDGEDARVDRRSFRPKYNGDKESFAFCGALKFFWRLVGG